MRFVGHTTIICKWHYLDSEKKNFIIIQDCLEAKLKSTYRTASLFTSRNLVTHYLNLNKKHIKI